MTLNLSEVEFDYDFFSLPLPSGNTLIMNKVDEDFVSEGGKKTVVKRVNIVVALEDGSGAFQCTSVIGMPCEYFTIDSGYPEWRGKVLTADNMQYCTMEIPDNE